MAVLYPEIIESIYVFTVDLLVASKQLDMASSSDLGLASNCIILPIWNTHWPNSSVVKWMGIGKWGLCSVKPDTKTSVLFSSDWQYTSLWCHNGLVMRLCGRVFKDLLLFDCLIAWILGQKTLYTYTQGQENNDFFKTTAIHQWDISSVPLETYL